MIIIMIIIVMIVVIEQVQVHLVPRAAAARPPVF